MMGSWTPVALRLGPKPATQTGLALGSTLGVRSAEAKPASRDGGAAGWRAASGNRASAKRGRARTRRCMRGPPGAINRHLPDGRAGGRETKKEERETKSYFASHSRMYRMLSRAIVS